MADEEAAQAAGTALAHRDDAGVAASQYVRGGTPGEILGNAGVIAKALKDLIETQGLAAPMGGGKKHVEVGAWQACGAMLGALGGVPLHAETIWTRRMLADDGVTLQRTTYTATVTRYPKGKGKDKPVNVTTFDVDGFDWEARVEVRTPDGTVVGSAEAMCSRGESTWSERDDNALRSMAETRAESRAYRRAIGWIIHMAGYSPTPAEEMGHVPGADTNVDPARAFGPEASEALEASLVKALAFMFDTGDGPDDKLAAEAFVAIAKQFAYVPRAVAQALVIAGGTLKRSIDGPLSPHEGSAADDAGPEPSHPEAAQGGGPEPDDAEPVQGEAVPDDDPELGPAPEQPADPTIEF